VPAEKWKANREPEADWRNLERLMGCLNATGAGLLILISTIDVYPDPSAPLDESAPIDPARNHAYGRHRFELEQWVRGHFADVRIVRLPALFGEGLKKNVVFDLLHDNQVGNINPASCFQWYPLARLNHDIETIRAQDIRLINLFPEPIRTSEIVDRFFPGASTASASEPAPVYDLRTGYSDMFGGPAGYMLSGTAVLDQLAAFVARERAKHARSA